MMSVLRSTSRVSRPVASEPLSGVWPQAGAARRVRQEDGHYVDERVLPNAADGFVYQIWGPTTAAGRHIACGRGAFRATPINAALSRLTWTYELKARAFWAQPFLDDFVRNAFSPFMEAGMDAFAESATAPLAE
jgi:hypothetical protein